MSVTSDLNVLEVEFLLTSLHETMFAPKVKFASTILIVVVGTGENCGLKNWSEIQRQSYTKVYSRVIFKR